MLPNAITVLRFLLIPVLVALLAGHRYGAAAAVFTISALSDLADGMIARYCNLRSRFGAIADPLADKLTMLTLAAVLAMQALLPPWLVAAIVLRDLAIVTGALAYHFVVGRYDMAPFFLSKLNTALSFVVLAGVLASAAGLAVVRPMLPALFGLLLATLAASGAQYVWVWGRRALRARRAARPTAHG